MRTLLDVCVLGVVIAIYQNVKVTGWIGTLQINFLRPIVSFGLAMIAIFYVLDLWTLYASHLSISGHQTPPAIFQFRQSFGRILLPAGIGLIALGFMTSLKGGLSIFEVTVREATISASPGSELHHFNQQSDTIIASIQDGVCMLQGSALSNVNRAFTEITGRSGTELSRLSWQDIIHPDDIKRVSEISRRRLAGPAAPDTYEARLVRPTGEIRQVVISARVVRDFKDGPATIGTFKDITASRRVGEALKSQSKALRLIEKINYAVDRAEFSDALGNCLSEICLYHGWSVGHVYLPAQENKNLLVSSKIWCLRGPGDFEQLQIVTNAREYTMPESFPGRALLDGSAAWIADITQDRNFARAQVASDIGLKAAFAFPVHVKDEVAAVFEFFSKQALDPDEQFLKLMEQVAAQIGRLFEREQAMRELRNKAELLNTIHEGVITVSQEWRILSWNVGARRVWGYSKNEIVGQHLSVLFDAGAEMPTPEEVAEICRCSDHFEGERRLRRKSGEIFCGRVSVSFHRQDKGSVSAAIIVVSDITEKRMAEEQLRQAQKMESVGQLTGGIAHDFNNLLTIIMGSVELAQETSYPTGIVRDCLNEILTTAERGAELTHRLVAFARQQPLQPKVIALCELVKGLIPLLKRTFGDEIEIEMIDCEDPWLTLADPGQLENSLLNLAINARDAMPDGGRLTIDIQNIKLDRAHASAQRGVPEGEYVVMSVSDEGTGMKPETLARVFEPFFTTKEIGQGSGLGLAMVYGFVKQSDGHVAIHSEAGEGTTVKIYLPRSLEIPSQTEATGQIMDIAARGETILVVEDDASIRTIAVTLLGKLGFRVLDAGDGETATAILEREPCIDLLLTDVVLPGDLRGPEVACEAEKQHPGIKLLFMSGYAAKAVHGRGSLPEKALLLQKPFRFADLGRIVREALAN